jgi:hypothetical protein
MSETPKDESLFDKAMRQAKQASAATVPASPLGEAAPAAALGAGVAGGLAQGLAPGTFSYHTSRPSAAKAFVDAFQGLADNDTRLQVSAQPDQTTVQFMQQLPTGGWAAAVTVTLIQAADQIKVTTSGQNMAALASAAGQLGGTALGVVGDLLRGPSGVGNALGRVSRDMGKVTEAATDLNLGGQVRSTVERIGGVLEEEWSAVQRQRREEEQRQLAATTCPYCGTLYPSDEATSCPKCNAPRAR